MMFLLRLWLYFSCLCNAFSYTVVDLSNEKWFIESSRLNVSIPVKIPGSVHTALLRNDIIKDPYVGCRDDQYAWIADQEWVFTTKFNVSTSLLDSPLIQLKFDGLDTISKVYLNGELLGKTNNMFVVYSYFVKGYLQKKNILKLYFSSPTKYCEEQSKNYFDQYGYNVPPISLPPVQHGRNHQNFIRKEQCSFSWDWGPSFPAIGIWKDVHLEYSQSVILDNVLVQTRYDVGKNTWTVRIEAVINSYIATEYRVLFGFANFMQKKEFLIKMGVEKVTLGDIEVERSLVQLWWPRGYGNQTLYQASVTVIHPQSLHIATKQVSFGFRTVELIQEPIDGSEGLSFYFKINSKPIFLKGANWIPADSFQERVSYTILENLFNSSIEANINALRVWGGGVYEQDRFYELADKLGVVIWQDLMFAVALYPTNEEFLDTVRKEIVTQVRRLQHHPSLIAWSGNNENEVAIAQTWWDEVKTNKEKLVSDYIKLYVKTIQPIVETEDSTRPFMMSSPSNGIESAKEGYIAKNPQDPLYGDVHFYNYKADCWNASMFPNPRFASEYGYQSYPSFITMSEVAAENDLKWNSSLMYHRQHHANGNEEIEQFIKLHYNLPSSINPQKYFHDMIYLSQIVQATCIKYESEHYRRLQGNLINGTGYTMGALYWQLNDIWQAPSWSSIEYGGRWKMLHYYVQRFFAPTAVTGYVQGERLLVYTVSDHPEKLSDFILNVTAHSWMSFEVLWNTTVNVARSTKPAVLVYENAIQHICASRMCFIKLELIDKNIKSIVSQTDVFLVSFSSITLKDPSIKVKEVSAVSDVEYEIKLHSESPAAFVWLETSLPGRFSDNGFVMSKSDLHIHFYSWYPIDTSMISSSLKVSSLYNVYQDDTMLRTSLHYTPS